MRKFQLLLEEAHELVHERSFKETDQNRKQFDHPKYVSDCSWGGIVTLSARTPWLMLRQGYDSIIKCVDPCSNTAYELNLPDLVDHTFRYSIDGWVIVSHSNSWFFFSSFTGKKIDIHLGTYCSDGVAVSSSPTNIGRIASFFPYSRGNKVKVLSNWSALVMVALLA